MPHQPNKPAPSPLPALLALGAIMGILALTILASPAQGQTVIRRVLQTNDGPIRAVSLPSLHNGIVAGYGLVQNFSAVIYAGRIDDPTNTPPHIVVADGDPVPNNPGRFFGSMRIPTVWNNAVYFSGRATSGTNPPDGLYAGTFATPGLAVVSDRLNGNGPWIDGPFAGALGVAFVNQGITSGTGAGISLYTFDQQLIPLVSYDQPLADGTQVSSTSSSSVAYGGNTIAYTMRAGFPDLNAAGYGAFAFDTATGQTVRIASMATTIPGDGRTIDIVGSIDTDGELVAIGAGNGHLYFGGIAVVCVANVDGSNFRVIARTGDPMPGLPGRTMFSVGRVAVDDGVVWFNATYRDGANERQNLFAHDLATGTTLPVVLYTDTINGVTENTPWFHAQGVHGRHAVIECNAPTATMGVSILTLVHAHITPPCTADLDNGSGTGASDGAVTIDDLLFFLNSFETGAVSADLDNGTSTGTPDGAVTIDDLLFFLVRFEAGC